MTFSKKVNGLFHESEWSKSVELDSLWNVCLFVITENWNLCTEMTINSPFKGEPGNFGQNGSSFSDVELYDS